MFYFISEIRFLYGRMLTSLSVDVILLLRYVNRSSNFRGLSLKVEMVPICLKRCFILVNAEINVFFSSSS